MPFIDPFLQNYVDRVACGKPIRTICESRGGYLTMTLKGSMHKICNMMTNNGRIRLPPSPEECAGLECEFI